MMSQNNKTARAIKKDAVNDCHYDMDLIDILSEEVVGIINSLIADNDLRRLVLADAYAKECVRNHHNGTPSEDLQESQDIVGEMIVDFIYGNDSEYACIFGDTSEDDMEDSGSDEESEDDPEDFFIDCVEKYIQHPKECCVYDEELKCIGCGLCSFGYSPRIPDDDCDDSDDDHYDNLGFDDEDFDDEDTDDSDDDLDIPCTGNCGGPCRGCCDRCSHDVDDDDDADGTIPRFEIIEGKLTITIVGRNWDV